MLAAVAAAASFSPADWSRVAPVTLPDNPGKGLAEFPISGEVHDAARPDLSDLRIVDSSGAEVGYVLRLPQADVPDVELKAQAYSRIDGNSPKKSVTLDFTKSVQKTRVEILTSGDSFHRLVTVESSDNTETWHSLAEGVTIMRRPASGDLDAYDRRIVSFPPDSRRYLRATVEPAPGDETPVRIDEVMCYDSTADLLETVYIHVPSPSVSPGPDGRSTEITLDLGYRNMPLWDMPLSFSDPNFFRRVTVYGRNGDKEVVRTPREDAPPAERTIDAPWQRVSSTAIYRYKAGGRPDESLAVKLYPATWRYLKVVIANGNDAPLAFTGVTVRCVIDYVQFAPRAGMSYSLYFGNPNAKRPAYDLSKYIDRLVAEGKARANLDFSTPNPAKKPAKGLPWSEQNRWVIWLALLAVLVWLVVRQLRSVADSSAHGPPAS